jgi:hypothetical protein
MKDNRFLSVKPPSLDGYGLRCILMIMFTLPAFYSAPPLPRLALRACKQQNKHGTLTGKISPKPYAASGRCGNPLRAKTPIILKQFCLGLSVCLGSERHSNSRIIQRNALGFMNLEGLPLQTSSRWWGNCLGFLITALNYTTIFIKSKSFARGAA